MLTTHPLVLAVYDGLSLNGDVTPRDKLQQFIDAALEEIEFVSGPADSTWGARRAELGHPEPFTLEYVEVGNEDWLAGGDLGWNSYAKYRFPLFQAAINAAYPDIEVLYSGSNWDSSSTGNFHPPKNPAIGDYVRLYPHCVRCPWLTNVSATAPLPRARCVG